MPRTTFVQVIGRALRQQPGQVERVGRAGDNGAEVVGVLPDGRTMICAVQALRSSNAIPAREIRDMMGARLRGHRRPADLQGTIIETGTESYRLAQTSS